jgi:hypothetical protein
VQPGVSPGIFAIAIPLIAGLLLGIKASPKFWKLPIWGAWITSACIAVLILALPSIDKQFGLPAMPPVGVAVTTLVYAWVFSLTSGLCMVSHREKRKAGGKILLWSLTPPLTTVILILVMTIAGVFPLHKDTGDKSVLEQPVAPTPKP